MNKVIKKDRWIKRWEVQGTTQAWIVALDKNGNWGCSCPVWKYRRQECHHIKFIKMNGGKKIKKEERPEYVLAKVLKPTYDKGKNRLYIPLIGIPDAHLMEATICYYLLKYGYSMGEIRKMRKHLPKSWTAKAIIEHVEENGKAEYPPDWYKH